MIDNDTCNHLILYNFLTSKTKISQKKKKKKNPEKASTVSNTHFVFSKYFTNKTIVGIMLAHKKANI